MLRAGTAEDVAAMYRLDCLCFEEPFRFDLRSMRRFATQSSSIVVVAEAEGELRGFAIVEVSRRRNRYLGYVMTIDVHPEFRREGLARRLMVEVERQAIERGVAQIGLHVFAGNEEAIGFYEGSGYVRIASVRDFYSAGFDAFSYLKELRK